MNIAYFANPLDNHDCKWINVLAETHNVHVICIPYSRAKKSYIENSKIQVHEILPRIFPYKNPFTVWKLKRLLKRFFKEKSIDIAHSMYAYPNAVYADLVATENHIITTRGSDVLVDYQKFVNPKNLKERIIYSILSRRMRRSFNRAKYITSTSIGQQNALKKLIKDLDKSLLIRTGINTALIDKMSFEKEKGAGLNVFSPRSMKPIYNIELVIDGFEAFTADRDGKDTLMLIDDFPESDYSLSIKKKIAGSRIEPSVQLLPSLSLEGMMQKYFNADMVIMTPKSDGTPNSALEAMYLKKPVVLGALPYDKDLFNDQTVWQLKENTFTEIKAAFTEILFESHEEKNAKLENAHNIVKDNAALNSALEKINQLYHQMIHD